MCDQPVYRSVPLSRNAQKELGETVKQVVPGMSQPENNLSYVSTLSKSDSQHADKIENAYSFQESAFVGVIGYSDHDCDRFEKVQIKEDIDVTDMNMTDIDKIGLSGPNITGESSYKLRKGDFEQANALYRTI